MIVSLSGLLRIALKHSASDLTSLQEELEFIRSYLDIEKLRLGKRLTVRFEIAPDTAQFLVPQLILQPLVENAIVHGISCNREGGWIEIASRASGETLEIEIRNSVGSGEGRKGVGLGLQNTTTRLKYLYNGSASLSFTVNEGRVAIAKLTIPALRSMGQVTMTTALKESEKDHLYASSDR
jgi:sensor histidine kinase YesM